MKLVEETSRASVTKIKPYGDICRPRDGAPTIEIELDYLQRLLAPLIDNIAVNSDWYIKKYQDVAVAFANHEIPSAEYHYKKFGYFENRLPREILVDERFYVESNADIAACLNRREITNLQEHFESFGFAEGRSPYLGWTL